MLQGKQMLRNTDSNHLTLPLRGEKKKKQKYTQFCVLLSCWESNTQNNG